MAKHSFFNRTCIHFIPLYPLLTALFALKDTGDSRQRLKPAEIVTVEVIDRSRLRTKPCLWMETTVHDQHTNISLTFALTDRYQREPIGGMTASQCDCGDGGSDRHLNHVYGWRQGLSLDR